ncbi:UDP-N-acetylmuramoyl-L-alanyl-D-glutamate--2,6-diaminopimelate ligase [Neisseria animalis]|uniref:UDP-N-acetylmuramoyl-L-alanyl-D-glutamate--2,6-diaminopimelate ligase n=1 Tax=Neisseria animalis TaxID=492 RepID=A0A5P3MQC3_NEIAN|nr:UDP-N-acetylmuramoyl-L-alanyl-D-glutamate--2,6-diaminopimelate ligase [Neisseria animalis]QEY23718.1 UDP-N-acetylmuramoyl-L-alanyl-D-glutamate--2,6-diaminopimelate ligase [Neisseria animalis]ROW32860.1 UDP-N-acetylmuramoyl-L-alanyl-D-glutamate--2,6-diaminopimelate ligase [Neisseria animalis]VEE09550.1 UDP-N-acetylmuramoylalanyl-D-glutamate--2, 6-diaminopimelate ligase [Neisseria animalis]
MFSKLCPLAETDLPALLCENAAGRLLLSDSRRIQNGDIFIACQGEYADGRSYIPAAIQNGAAFVFWDDDGSFVWNEDWAVPNQGIRDLKHRAGILAAQVYNNIADGLKIWGVTGTNGKTSITQWLAQAADLLGGKCAVIGTVGNGFWGQLEETSHTTPDPVTVQTLLHRFKQQGATSAAMEVSSHGLDQCRVNGVPFQTAVFTNLTRDHLDYHGTMAAYGEIKARLFYWNGLKNAVINVDDEYGSALAGRLQKECPDLAVYGYGFGETAAIRIAGFAASSDGMKVVLETPWGRGECKTRLLGRFNAQNLAACVGVLCAEGYPLDKVLEALAQIRPATGRMDCMMNEGKPLVVVDYAHTSDALEKALSTLQEIKPEGADLWCVFGCGGNRDRGKRPLMGAAAAAGADKVVVTSDNPRLEEPQDIINDILPAVPNPEKIESDRKAAIEYAVANAASHDIILIAGKGHETYQDIKGVKHHFSDFEIAERALAERDKA